VALGGWWFRQQSRVRWAREQLPRVSELAANGSFNAAFNLLQEVEAQDPSNPELHRLWGEVSRDIFLSSDPPGVDVFRKDLDAPEPDWRLGRHPKNAKVPRGYYQFKLSGPNVETSLTLPPTTPRIRPIAFQSGRRSRAWCSSTRQANTGYFSGGQRGNRPHPYVLIDATEVTNRDFKKLSIKVDTGRRTSVPSATLPTPRPIHVGSGDVPHRSG
jgi:hypothetical protein